MVAHNVKPEREPAASGDGVVQRAAKVGGCHPGVPPRTQSVAWPEPPCGALIHALQVSMHPWGLAPQSNGSPVANASAQISAHLTPGFGRARVAPHPLAMLPRCRALCPTQTALLVPLLVAVAWGDKPAHAARGRRHVGTRAY